MSHSRFSVDDATTNSEVLSALPPAPEGQRQPAQQRRYQRPILTRVGQWQTATLTMTIPIGPGNTGVIYGGNT